MINEDQPTHFIHTFILAKILRIVNNRERGSLITNMQDLEKKLWAAADELTLDRYVGAEEVKEDGIKVSHD